MAAQSRSGLLPLEFFLAFANPKNIDPQQVTSARVPARFMPGRIHDDEDLVAPFQALCIMCIAAARKTASTDELAGILASLLGEHYPLHHAIDVASRRLGLKRKADVTVHCDSCPAILVESSANDQEADAGDANECDGLRFTDVRGQGDGATEVKRYFEPPERGAMVTIVDGIRGTGKSTLLGILSNGTRPRWACGAYLGCSAPDWIASVIPESCVHPLANTIHTITRLFDTLRHIALQRRALPPTVLMVDDCDHVDDIARMMLPLVYNSRYLNLDIFLCFQVETPRSLLCSADRLFVALRTLQLRSRKRVRSRLEFFTGAPVDSWYDGVNLGRLCIVWDNRYPQTPVPWFGAATTASAIRHRSNPFLLPLLLLFLLLPLFPSPSPTQIPAHRAGQQFEPQLFFRGGSSRSLSWSYWPMIRGGVKKLEVRGGLTNGVLS